MSATDLLESLRTDADTELSRLGSSKALFAETDGEMDADEVLRAAAVSERAAAETFESWADDESNGAAREAFATTADEEVAHYETIRDRLGEDPEPAEVPPLHAYLRDLDGTVERAGGFLGRLLVTRASKSQFTGFFVGRADPKTASVFRGFGDDLDAQLDRAQELLDEVCDSEDDWERAREAARGAIDVSYETYIEALESLGVNPKPVC
ncbi:rubrerythrin family protein [Haloferacaceae archaeon DSL9]